MCKKRIYFLLFFAVKLLSASAQQFFVIQITNNPIPNEKGLIKKINKCKSDSLRQLLFERIVDNRNKSGYYNFSSDTANGKVSITFHSQLLIDNIKISAGLDNLNELCITKTRRFLNNPLNTKNFNNLQGRCLQVYQNSGYPFASIAVDSSVVSGNKVSLDFYISPGPLIVYDSLIVKGNARIDKNYLKRRTNIFTGKIYNEQDVFDVKNRVDEIVFVKQIKSPDIVFFKDKARVIYYLDKQNANQFDGFAGFLPDNVTGKINITGQAQIKLLNSFGIGENFEINWRKLQPLTQDLRLIMGFPLLFGTRFGIENQFKLYKRDTTFIDLTNSARVLYFLNSRNSLTINLNTRNSSLITPEMYRFASVLPDFADVKSTLYGLGLKSEFLDYGLNPRKGFKLVASAQAGTRKIIKNPILNEQIYNGLQLVTNQYSGTINSDFYIPLFSKSTINLSVDAGGIIGNSLFRNELYRIGGLISFRGFDEESINASAFTITTIEYRYLFEKNSNLYVFFDGGWYENNSIGTYVKDMPFGFGTGISFQTKAGIFTINYALGKQFNNPIILRSAKIHFGLVNYF